MSSIEVERVLPGRLGLVAGLLGFGAHRHPPLLVVGGRVRGQVGFVLEVPAFPALGSAQGPGPLGAGRADMGQGVPARDEHLVHLAGVEVGAAELDRADAGAVLDGQVLDHLPGQRHGHPLRPGRLGGRFGHWLTSACVVSGPGVGPAAQPALSPRR